MDQIPFCACCANQEEDLVVRGKEKHVASPGLALDEVPGPYPDAKDIFKSEPAKDEQKPVVRLPYAASEDKHRPMQAGNGKKGLDGTWMEAINSSGEMKYHWIQSKSLTWADRSVTQLQRDDADAESFHMIYNNQQMTARLAAGGSELHWSDSDVWKRAGLDGKWQESKSPQLVHAIRGNILSAEGRDWQLMLQGENEFSLDFQGTVVTARLDSIGQKLQWSDGDSWNRQNYDQCPGKFPHERADLLAKDANEY
jgi:hypothetical protein